MKRFLGSAVIILLTLALAACGDDGGDGDSGSGSGSGSETASGDAEAFCERLEELDEESSVDLEDEEGFEALQELQDLAPDDVSDDLDTLVEAGERLEELDEDDLDSFEEAFEIILDPEVTGALEDFASFAEDECGIEIEDASGLEDLSDLSDISDFSADLSSDFSSDFSTDFSDEGPSLTDQLEAYLDENYADEPWLELIGSRGTGSAFDELTNVTLGMDEVIPPEDAVEACEAALEWGADFGDDDTEAEVLGPDQETLASGTVGDGCQAA